MHRYAALIERAKQLVHFVNQTEAAMLAAIEKHDAEAYGRLAARHKISASTPSKSGWPRLECASWGRSIKLCSISKLAFLSVEETKPGLEPRRKQVYGPYWPPGIFGETPKKS